MPAPATLAASAARPTLELAQDAAGATTVFIRDLAVTSLIGVHEHERRKPRTLLMDLDIELHASCAGRTDRLGDTIDYAAVVDDIRRCLAQKRYFLLERLAEFVAERILERFGAKRVAVQVAKARILRGVGLVGVRIERRAPAPRLVPVPGKSAKAAR